MKSDHKQPQPSAARTTLSTMLQTFKQRLKQAQDDGAEEAVAAYQEIVQDLRETLKPAGTRKPLEWTDFVGYQEAFIGDFAQGDGVRFTLTHHPTCYRRGPWRLLVEVASGPRHELWGCFDMDDQPMRYYHQEPAALSEAQAISDVLWEDRSRRASGEK